jgi:hypothetical protein
VAVRGTLAEDERDIATGRGTTDGAARLAGGAEVKVVDALFTLLRSSRDI